MKGTLSHDKNLSSTHGYLALSRHTKLILRDMNYSLYGFYILLVGEAVWDSRKPMYGYVMKTNAVLGKVISCSESTVSRNLVLLQRKGYIEKKDEGVHIIDFLLFDIAIARKVAKNDFANMQVLRAFVQELSANMQLQHANMQGNQPQNLHQSSTVSFKGDLRFSPSELNEHVDPDEVERGIEEMKRGNLQKNGKSEL